MNEYTEYNLLPIIDEDQVAMLADDDDPSSAELLKELLELFEEDSQNLMTSLNDALEKEDFDLAARTAHSLAGSGSNIGGKRLWGICKLLESKSKENELGLADKYYDELRSIFQSTIEGLKAEIVRIEG